MHFLFDSLGGFGGFSKSHNLGKSPDDEKLLAELREPRCC